MTISSNLAASISDFLFQDSNFGLSHYHDAPSFSSNNVFPKLLYQKLTKNSRCFLPVIDVSEMIHRIIKWLKTEDGGNSLDLFWKLYIGATTRYKTIAPIFSDIVRGSSRFRLSKIITGKGMDYYGGNGIIFDANWEPLMIAGSEAFINSEKLEVNAVTPICYVSPQVFDRKDMLSKAIINKIVPYLSTTGAYKPRWLTEDPEITAYPTNSYRVKVPVVITDLSKFFVTPVAPNNTDTIDDKLWECLDKNTSKAQCQFMNTSEDG